MAEVKGFVEDTRERTARGIKSRAGREGNRPNLANKPNQAMKGEIETERGGERINSQESELMAETAVVRSCGKGSPLAGEV